MKKIYLGILIIVAIITTFFIYKNFFKPIETVEIKDSPFSVYIENEKNNSKDEYIETKDWYEVKMQLPKNNKIVSDKIFNMWNDFAKESKLKDFKNYEEAKEGLGLFNPDAKYTFYAEYKTATGTLNGVNTFTYIYQVYTFTGGAHGSTVVIPITIDESKKILVVEEILPDNKLEKVSKFSYDEISKQRVERLKSFGMTDKEIKETLKDNEWMKEGTKATRDNFSAAWPEGENLVVSFGQYQVAAYAEGMFEVTIPQSVLK